MKDLLKSYSLTMRHISQAKLWGWLPLDSVLHFFIGMFLCLLLRWRKVSAVKAVLVVFILEIIKEIADSRAMTFTYREAFVDIVATMIFPVLMLIAGIIKKKYD